MKTILMMLLVSFSAQSAVECVSGNLKLNIQRSGRDEITITFQNETTVADGIVTNSEVDLIAKFVKAGEMTLFAKIGKTGPENYLFLKGTRLPVVCK